MLSVGQTAEAGILPVAVDSVAAVVESVYVRLQLRLAELDIRLPMRDVFLGNYYIWAESFLVLGMTGYHGLRHMSCRRFSAYKRRPCVNIPGIGSIGSDRFLV